MDGVFFASQKNASLDSPASLPNQLLVAEIGRFHSESEIKTDLLMLGFPLESFADQITLAVSRSGEGVCLTTGKGEDRAAQSFLLLDPNDPKRWYGILFLDRTLNGSKSRIATYSINGCSLYIKPAYADLPSFALAGDYFGQFLSSEVVRIILGIQEWKSLRIQCGFSSLGTESGHKFIESFQLSFVAVLQESIEDLPNTPLIELV